MGEVAAQRQQEAVRIAGLEADAVILARVVHQTVDVAALTEGSSYGPAAFVGGGQLCLNGVCPAPGRGEGPDSGIVIGGIAADDDRNGALGGEDLGDAAADAACPARYQNHPVAQLEIHYHLLDGKIPTAR